MKVSLLRFTLPVICLLTAQVQGQQPAAAPAAAPAPAYYQAMTLVKTMPGKGNEWVKLVRDTTMKVAQMRADSGEIVSWTLLRAVMPAGQEARADYIISTLYQGVPPAPVGGTAMADAWKKAGVTMTTDQASAIRNSTSSLVSSEMWRINSRAGAPAKGHYIMINFMKVKDANGYRDFANSVSKPIAEERVKGGDMSGWLRATRVVPSGTDQAYSSYTADMYPTWAAVFGGRPAQEVFEKVFPGKNGQDSIAAGNKVRDLAKRELWVVQERVTKSK